MKLHVRARKSLSTHLHCLFYYNDEEDDYDDLMDSPTGFGGWVQVFTVRLFIYASEVGEIERRCILKVERKWANVLQC